MNSIETATEFDPAVRVSHETLQTQTSLFVDNELLITLSNTVFDSVIILNSQRQIVFFNDNVLKTLGLGEELSIEGVRPGEALECIHSSELPNGCGATEYCQLCGFVESILALNHRDAAIQECRILRKDGSEALDLLVKSSRLTVQGETFTLLAIKDASHENRRKILERAFFHDLMNVSSALLGISELLTLTETCEIVNYKKLFYSGIRQIVEEIGSYRDLTFAENHELICRFVEIESLELLDELVDLYRKLETAEGRFIVIASESENVALCSDKTLLVRVLGNMIKNALEASNPGQTVTIGSQLKEDGVEFWVHNSGVIPKEVALKIFQRSFSSKGAGRGIGAYSMKLLSERYLNGKVYFKTSESEGTTFMAWYPISVNC
jgi:signal transduction histidine kinase